MDNHSSPMRTSSQSPPPPTVVQHQPAIIPDVSSPTTEASPKLLNLDDNYSCTDEAYIEPGRSITTDRSAKWYKKTIKNPIQNLTDIPKLPTFDLLQLIVPPNNAWKQLHISFSDLNIITPIQFFHIFLTNSMMGPLVANTNSYAGQQHLGPEMEWLCSWQPVTALEHNLWLAIQMLQECLIPIINTTFIQLSTTTYLIFSFFPHLILRLNLLAFPQELSNFSSQSAPSIDSRSHVLQLGLICDYPIFRKFFEK